MNSAHYNEGTGACVVCHSDKNIIFWGHIRLVSRWTNCVENGDNVKNYDLTNFVLQLY